MDRTAYIPIKHDDDYWQHDLPLFIGTFPYYRMELCMVQGKVSIYEEHYNTRIATEIIPLHHAEGTRHSVHLKPYILEPQLFLTVGLYTTPKHYADQDEVIGEVLKTEEKGMRLHEIGNAQACYYPAERMIVVWECYLGDLRTHPLAEDTHMGKLWRSFEQWLSKQFPEATRIVTPFNDPIARTIEEYQTFLQSLGYKPVVEAAFGKQLQ